MKGVLALIISYIFLRVSAETAENVPGGFSEDDKQNVDSIMNLLSCLDDPLCDNQLPADQPSQPTYQEHIRIRIENYNPSITPEEYEAIFHHQLRSGLIIKGECELSPFDTSMPKPAYLALCEDINSKLENLEIDHPELKDLKLELLERFDRYSAQFKGTFKKGEPVIIKVLDMILEVIRQVKKDFGEKPCPVVEEPWVEEIIAEEDEIPYIGSVRGIPGVDYPNYTEVPITSFSCSDKHVPGFYADLETGCQVFHVCYEHRRESFLCPLGTIFNQPILACDYWYSSNCSLAPNYYDKHDKHDKDHEYTTTEGPITEEPIEIIDEIHEEKDFTKLVPFIPVKAKIVDYPKKPEEKPVVTVITGVKQVATKIFGEDIAKEITYKPKVVVPVKVEPVVADKVFEGVVTTGLKATTKARDTLGLFSKPMPAFVKVVKPHPVAKTAAIKAKFAAAAVKVPLAKSVIAAAKVPVVKAAAAAAVKLPVVKAKFATAAVKGSAVKAGVAAAVKVPVVKAKVAGVAAAAVKVPLAKAKVAGVAAAVKVPIVKGKVAGVAAAAVKVPLAKAKVAGFAAGVKVPVVKAKVAGAAATAVKVPIVKAKIAGSAAAAVKVPVVKAKVAASVVKVPIAKAKVFKAAAVPFFKVKAVAKPLAKVKVAGAVGPALVAKKVVKMAPLVKVAAIPVMKAKLASSAAIAPLTKKALALGYLKLLKAKKFVVLG